MHGSQAVYCTTELCLSVDKLKKEKKKHREGMLLAYTLSIVKLRVLTVSKKKKEKKFQQKKG